MDEFGEIAKAIAENKGGTLFGSFAVGLAVWRVLRRERLSYSEDNASQAEADSRAANAKTTELLIISLRDEIIRLNKIHENKDALIESLHSRIYEIEAALHECRDALQKQEKINNELSIRIRSMNAKFDIIKLRAEDCEHRGDERRKSRRISDESDNGSGS